MELKENNMGTFKSEVDLASSTMGPKYFCSRFHKSTFNLESRLNVGVRLLILGRGETMLIQGATFIAFDE